MSSSPYFYEEILRQRQAEMQRNELQAQLAAQLRAERPRSSRLSFGRMLIARIPRLSRARVAYT